MLPMGLSMLVVHVHGEQHNDPPRHFIHDRHHISILLEGPGTYYNGPCPLPPRPCLSFLPAGHEDINGLVGPVDAWYVGFDWPGVTIAAQGKTDLQLTFTPPAGAATAVPSLLLPRAKALDHASAARCVERFSALKAASLRQDAAGQLACGSLLLQLMADYIDQPATPTAAHGHRTLARFHELLIAEACAPVTIQQLAKRAGATADHLRDLFHARYGLRPVAFRTGVRLARARDLLTATRLNVGEVARQVGYPDPLYFSRAFRKHFGFTPSELIRRYRLPD